MSINNGQAVMIATLSQFPPDNPGEIKKSSDFDDVANPGNKVAVFAAHAYAVVGVTATTIKLYDPRLKNVIEFELTDADINKTDIFNATTMRSFAP